MAPDLGSAGLLAVMADSIRLKRQWMGFGPNGRRLFFLPSGKVRFAGTSGQNVQPLSSVSALAMFQ
jgi:hypothetical protein